MVKLSSVSLDSVRNRLVWTVKFNTDLKLMHSFGRVSYPNIAIHMWEINEIKNS